MELNDQWLFTFEEFSMILARAPKTYNIQNITRQRLLDSIEWLNYIQTFRQANYCSFSLRASRNWASFIRWRKIALNEVFVMSGVMNENYISIWDESYL
jgi:hypothetical protein